MNVRGRPCLLVGGGEVAARKARVVLEAGASVTVVAPALGPTLGRLVTERRVVHRAESFDENQLQGHSLVFAATDDRIVNERVHRAAVSRGIPVNVTDP